MFARFCSCITASMHAIRLIISAVVHTRTVISVDILQPQCSASFILPITANSSGFASKHSS